MSSIRKLHSGKWQVQVRRAGTKPITKSFHKKSDAAEWARWIEAKVDRRDLPQDPKQLDNITLKSLLERYRDEIITKKRCTEQETSMIDAFISRKPKLVLLSLSCILPSHFAVYRDERLKTVKPATICRELGLFHHAYVIGAKEWDLPIVTNPLSKISKPQINNMRERCLSDNELDIILTQSTICKNKLIQPIILFAIETAMRRGEILNAKWKHVNWDARTLHIPEAKNGHKRDIPLTSQAVKILQSLDRDHTRIFPTTANTVKMAWQRIMRRAEIEDLHFHDLRHEAISRFFEKGLSVAEVALISGHRDFRQLFRYTHLKAENLVDKIN